MSKLFNWFFVFGIAVILIKARKFAEDRKDRFLLSVKDNSFHDHIHEIEKYGPQQLIAFLQNGKEHAEAEHGAKAIS